MSERDLNNTVTPNPKLAVDYCGIKMKNPIIAASGTFGNGPEYAGYLDLSNEVGAISVKGLTPKGRHLSLIHILWKISKNYLNKTCQQIKLCV